MRSDELPYAIVTILGALVLLGLAIRSLWLRAREPQEPESKPELEPVIQEAPRCVAGLGCGKLATHPMPRVERGRASALRDYLAFPPTYRLLVDKTQPAKLCSSHAHFADSKVSEFLADQRAFFTRSYAQAAQRAAVFEQEDLPRMICESLTADQIKNARRSVPAQNHLALVKRNGTTDEP